MLKPNIYYHTNTVQDLHTNVVVHITVPTANKAAGKIGQEHLHSILSGLRLTL